MQWQQVFAEAGDSDEEPPFPKMLDGDESMLGPYVPTEVDTVQKALEFAGVGPRDRVLDIGSGDGRFCCAAVQQFGASCAVGVEIDAQLVDLSRSRAELCSVADRVHFACADLTDPAVDAAALCPGGQAFTLLIVFLLPEAEQRFVGQLMRVAEAGARVLSIAFALDRLPGLELVQRQTPLYLYKSVKSAD